MYPLSSIIKDIALFPRDYLLGHHPIHTVRNVTLAITHRCNLRCEMCYFHEELSTSHELPFELYKKIINSLKPSRPCVILSGGEPSLHRDLIEMVTYAKKAGLPVQIFTNGLLIKPALADALIEGGLDYIDFSLLGDEASHNQVAGIPNAYELLIKHIEYFASKRQSTKIILNYTVTPRALQDIDHAVELVKRYTLDGLRIQHYNFLLPGEFDAQCRIMTKTFGMDASTHEIENTEDISAMANQLIAFKRRLSQTGPKIPVQWAPTLSEQEIRHWYSHESFSTQRKCLFPWRGILVDADGKIYPCSKIYLELGDLKEQDVLDAWNSEHMEMFRGLLKKNLFPACSRCCKL